MPLWSAPARPRFPPGGTGYGVSVAARGDDPDITAWAFAAARGDETALIHFVRATQRDVHRLVSHLGGGADTEDLVQETYLRAYSALPRFAGESSARTWLLSIARRVAADAVRRAQRRPRTDAVEDWERVGARQGMAHGSAEGEVVLRTLIAELDADRRDAFVLTQLLDLGYAEAALVCGCPVGTIRSRVARAREDLAAALAAPTRVRRREA